MPNINEKDNGMKLLAVAWMQRPTTEIVYLMQMLAYFIATAAAISLIVSLLYLATFKASDSTYPPRRDSFENVP